MRNINQLRRIYLNVARSYRADLRAGRNVNKAAVQIETAQIQLALLRRARGAA